MIAYRRPRMMNYWISNNCCVYKEIAREGCALPDRWLRVLENGEKGRDYVIALADRLYQQKLVSNG